MLLQTGSRQQFQNISCYCLTVKQSQPFWAIILFQNISCYCLTKIRIQRNQRFIAISKHLMLLFNYTLHQTYGNPKQFQNISCYCLTPVLATALIELQLFQNISCYCLTRRNSYPLDLQIDFKTSHVIV